MENLLLKSPTLKPSKKWRIKSIMVFCTVHISSVIFNLKNVKLEGIFMFAQERAVRAL